MRRKIFILSAGFLIASVFSCGLFTPRNVENPGDDTFIDPFRLDSILNGTGEKFSKASYEDILDDNFQFIAWDNTTYNRDREIERLKTLKASNSTLSTVWDTCEGTGEIRGETSMTLCRTFFVTYGNSNNIVTDTGKVEFTLTRSSGNIWTILEWNESSIRSIFHP
jgi:hypothetical protein